MFFCRNCNYRTQPKNTAKKLQMMSRSYNFFMKNYERICAKTGVSTIYQVLLKEKSRSKVLTFSKKKILRMMPSRILLKRETLFMVTCYFSLQHYSTKFCVQKEKSVKAKVFIKLPLLEFHTSR